jgi:hypothetical protein
MGDARGGGRRGEKKVPEEITSGTYTSALQLVKCSMAPRICGKRVFHGGNDLNRIDDALYFAS